LLLLVESQPGLISLAVSIHKAVFPNNTSALAQFQSKLNEWRTVRNEGSHTVGGYARLAKSPRFAMTRQNFDNVCATLDGFLGALEAYTPDRDYLLKSVFDVLLPKG
jgi:hypothetical protein